MYLPRLPYVDKSLSLVKTTVLGKEHLGKFTEVLSREPQRLLRKWHSGQQDTRTRISNMKSMCLCENLVWFILVYYQNVGNDKFDCNFTRIKHCTIFSPFYFIRRLSHLNIVRLMAAARTESCFLLANEYIHGAPLDPVLHMENCSVKVVLVFITCTVFSVYCAVRDYLFFL